MLSASGAVTMGSAIPIIMGQNIGTCVTAMISSVGANKNARRAALVHLYFNILGTIVWLMVFSILNYIFSFAFVNQAATPFTIAIAHTAFNILSTALLFPFTKQLEWLAVRSIPDKRISPKRSNYLTHVCLQLRQWQLTEAELSLLLWQIHQLKHSNSL